MCVPVFAAAATALGASAGTAATIGTVASIGSTVLSAYSNYQQARVSKAVAENNARTAEYQAQDAQRRGEQEAIEAARRGAAVKSSQRATMAARGLDLGFGTAQDLQDQTDFFAQTDAGMARHNAAKEAWARRAQGASYQAEADNIKPGLYATSSLLSGASQVASKWYTPASAGFGDGLSQGERRRIGVY